MTNQKNVTEQTNKSNPTEQFTDGVWLYSQIPEGDNRVDVDVRLILDRQHYERFMALIQNDAEIFREIASTLMCDKLEQWTGRRAHVAEPEIVAQLVDAAMNKHMPLRKEA